MFDEVKITRHITENYTDFNDNTLVEKKPVPNWPKLLGERAAEVINKHNEGKPAKVLVVYGGVSSCSNTFHFSSVFTIPKRLLRLIIHL